LFNYFLGGILSSNKGIGTLGIAIAVILAVAIVVLTAFPVELIAHSDLTPITTTVVVAEKTVTVTETTTVGEVTITKTITKTITETLTVTKPTITTYTTTIYEPTTITTTVEGTPTTITTTLTKTMTVIKPTTTTVTVTKTVTLTPVTTTTTTTVVRPKPEGDMTVELLDENGNVVASSKVALAVTPPTVDKIRVKVNIYNKGAGKYGKLYVALVGDTGTVWSYDSKLFQIGDGESYTWEWKLSDCVSYSGTYRLHVYFYVFDEDYNLITSAKIESTIYIEVVRE